MIALVRIRILNPYYSILVNRTRNFFSSNIYQHDRNEKDETIVPLYAFRKTGEETNFLERPLIDQPFCLQIVTWLYTRGISSSRVVSAMYAKEFYEANVFDCDLCWSNEGIQYLRRHGNISAEKYLERNNW